VTALEDLLRTLGPPLDFLAGAPHQLVRATLPTRALREKIARAAAAADDARLRDTLAEVELVLGRLTPVEGGASAAGRAAALAQARELLEELRRFRAAPTPPAYGRTPGPIRPLLDALRLPVQFVKGVGPRRAEQLGAFGIHTVEDLLFHLPFRYEDRRGVQTIAGARPGGDATVVAVLESVHERWGGRGRRKVLEATAHDATGTLALAWYHQLHYFRTRFRPGQRVLVHGRVEARRRGALRMIHPEVEILEGEEDADVGRIVPVYGKPQGVSAGAMRRLVRNAVEHYASRVPSALPSGIAGARGLLDLATALCAVHCPPGDADVAPLNAGTSPAHRAIVYDELFYLQLGMALRRSQVAREPGIAFTVPAARADRLRATLPFTLTDAQARVVREIEHDMAAPHPMHRLVQGDVGSGKTVVALYAAAIAVESGHQVALMAPTELLAEQHCETMRRLGAPIGLTVALLTGRVQGKLRARTQRAIARGDIDLVVGTHALIQEGITFKRLGLGVIDEQHRFGVMQRATLKHHGSSPDILLMTATPIPRTLALTYYGDLEVSALDELPPGRRPVVTRVFHERQRDRVLELVCRELDAGRQAYVVCPLVTESDKTDLADATSMARDLAAGPLREHRLGLVHGQMRSDEKDEVMRRFRAGEYQVLVCTTVIEVGIDVPNATVMIIEHAERFGLAQLHQLRGRVGRGAHRSLCLLIASYARGDQARERLRIMEETGDGFRIAEKDLELRGPGEFLGTRQSGLPDFRAANLLRDGALLPASRDDATTWLAGDPELRSPEAATVREALEARWAGRLELARIG
jgi:ATP-dependent DNA helicase RecG